jgi:hypothetical protein
MLLAPFSPSCFMVLLLLTGAPARGGVREIRAGANFRAAVEGLPAGDTLIVHQGHYAVDRTIAIKVKASSSGPTVIRGANGERSPLIHCIDPESSATIQIDGAIHLTLQGLEITGSGGDGVRLIGKPSHIILENLVIRDVDVGINFRSDMHHIVVRRNHIFNTGLLGGTGEGLYVGCNYAECVVRDSLIEANWIHDTLRASQGDGIELKRGSHSIIVRDNVIHDTNYPCILAVGAEGKGKNVIEGNVVWNCGDAGIQVTADALVRNNIILEGPGVGFNSMEHQEVTPSNLEFVHNTVVGGNPCVRLADWGYQVGLVFANNAVYCERGRFTLSDLTGAIFKGNVFYPGPSQVPAYGFFVGRPTGLDLLGTADRNVYPTPDSSLIAAGDADFAVPNDFNGNSRTGIPDAGAYGWNSPHNPGWPIAPGFKIVNEKTRPLRSRTRTGDVTTDLRQGHGR